MDEASFPTAPPSLDDACALFLDVDGTLIGFSEHPAQVELAETVREDIRRLRERLGGALALVSGRPLPQLDALFAPLRLAAAGLHGHQLRTNSAAPAPAPAPAAPSTSEWLHQLHQRAARLAHAHPGVLVEDKDVSLALHWRAAPEAADAVRRFAEGEIDALSGYRLQPGDHVIEFVPDGCDKGDAVAALMREPAFAGRRPVFVGDDLTDEFGFAAVNRLGGWSVLVGHRAGSQARYVLNDIAAVHAWLHANAGA